MGVSCNKPCPLPISQSPTGLGKRCNRPVSTGSDAPGSAEGFRLVPRFSRSPASHPALASSEPAPQAALPDTVGRAGAAPACAFLGWSPLGAAPQPPSSDTSRLGDKHGHESKKKRWDSKWKGRGLLWRWPGSQKRWGWRQRTDQALQSPASRCLPRALSQAICGLPRLGRAATGFPESLHCGSISGCGAEAPPGPSPSPTHS